MNANDIIRSLLREKGITSESIGKMIGIEGRTFRRRLQNDNPTINSIVPVLDVLGYELVIQKKRAGGKRSAREHLVTMEVRR